MKPGPQSYLAATIACAALTFPAPSTAQSVPEAPRTGPASEASPMFQRHHAMAGIMQDMVKEMSRMQERMSAGPTDAAAQREMAARMKRMSGMMQRMAGWADRPTMSEPEMRKRYEMMRREMDEMKKGP